MLEASSVLPHSKKASKHILQRYKSRNLTEENLKIYSFFGLKGEPGPSPPWVGAPLAAGSRRQAAVSQRPFQARSLLQKSPI